MAFLITLLISAGGPWPPDANEDGREDLLDVRAIQIATRPTKIECLFRPDGKTPADRPARAAFFDSLGRRVGSAPVDESCFARPIGLSVEIVGEDIKCLESDGVWRCRYTYWVDGQSRADGSMSATVCTLGPTRVEITTAATFSWTAAGVRFRSAAPVCVTIEGSPAATPDHPPEQ
jgi:hypothetical protein